MDGCALPRSPVDYMIGENSFSFSLDTELCVEKQ